MMMGTNEVSTPKKAHFLFSFLNAPMALSPVFRPMAISATIKAKPKVTAKIMYTSKKVPPPYFAAR